MSFGGFFSGGFSPTGFYTELAVGAGLRQTPRVPYLPNVPRFVYGTTVLTMSLPSTLIDPSVGNVGGDIEADSGVRTAFFVRRDDLFTFTLRIWETEWPSVQLFVNFAQTGQPFVWYPDIVYDPTRYYIVRLKEPTIGKVYYASPLDEYPAVLLLTLTVVRAVNAPELVESDAILRPRSLYYNGYDTGAFQSFDRGIDSHIGAWEIRYSGGREDGGYAVSVPNATNGGQYTLVRIFTQSVFGEIESRVFKAGKGIAWNLFGRTLTDRMNILALANTDGAEGGSVEVQFVISILPDRRLQAALYIGGVFIPIATSDVTVPATGWFGLELQGAISMIGHDTSGFVLLRLYTESGPAAGVSAIREINVKTRSSSNYDTMNAYVWGTEVIRGRGPGVAGIGVDDVHLYGDYGTIKRLMGNLFIGPGWPTADAGLGESTVIFDSAHVVNGELIGGVTVHGGTSRANNLVGSPTRTDLEELTGEATQEAFFVGEVVGGVWLQGPYGFGSDGVVRNTFNGTARDVYQLRIERSGMAEIEGVAPFLGSGFRHVLASVSGIGHEFNWTGFHFPDRDLNSTIRVGLVLNGVVQLGRYELAQYLFTGRWGAMHGLGKQYTVNPWTVLDRDPNGAAWTEDKLRATNGLVQGDFTLLDAAIAANPGVYDRWIEFDIAQFGIEYAYRKTALTILEHPPYPPMAKLIQMGYGENTLVVRAAAIDWDGEIVSRVVDWGDGSPPESIGESVRSAQGLSTPSYPTLSHTYEHGGTYQVTLTVTDDSGLMGTDVIELVVANRAPSANFSFDGSGEDVDFTDESIDPDPLGSIVAWDWDFGDGSSHATTQNPSHTYAAPGTYDVTLVVMDDDGATDSITGSVTTPIGAAGDCTLSADALADTAYVQGDDLNGGNPPLPAYANTSAFDAYYTGSGTFREAYDNSYAAAGVDHRIDAMLPFNGHPTLQMDFGAGHFGAGWDTKHTDDGDPTETYYTSAPNGPTGFWFRRILKAEAGVMSDGAASAAFTGLTVVEIFGSNIDYAINIRQGRVKVDVSHRPISDGHAFQTDTFDVGAESLLVGTAGFVELIGHYTRDLGARTSRLKLWIGDACSLAAAAPTWDSGNVDSHIGTSGTSLTRELALSGFVSNFNYNFTPSGAIKHLNWALWEQEPDSVSANPYGVGSP